MTHHLPDMTLPDLLVPLAACGEVHAPLYRNGASLAWGRVEDPGLVVPGSSRTILPPKKYLLPVDEPLLDWDASGSYRLVPPPVQPLILFGVPPCDLAAIAYLDRVFLAPPADSWYRQRRANLTLIGCDCRADGYCASPCPASATGADLYVHEAAQGLNITPQNRRGEELLARLERLLPRPVTQLPPAVATATANQPAPPPSLEQLADHPLWREFAATCLACGACSVCCPTCSCFYLHERPGLGDGSARRSRHADNCLFRDHGRVAGGGDFRPSRRERLEYRYRHKYLGFGNMSGVRSCSGCGRCRVLCPVGIDLERLLETAHASRP